MPLRQFLKVMTTQHLTQAQLLQQLIILLKTHSYTHFLVVQLQLRQITLQKFMAAPYQVLATRSHALLVVRRDKQ